MYVVCFPHLALGLNNVRHIALHLQALQLQRGALFAAQLALGGLIAQLRLRKGSIPIGAHEATADVVDQVWGFELDEFG